MDSWCCDLRFLCSRLRMSKQLRSVSENVDLGRSIYFVMALSLSNSDWITLQWTQQILFLGESPMLQNRRCYLSLLWLLSYGISLHLLFFNKSELGFTFQIMNYFWKNRTLLNIKNFKIDLWSLTTYKIKMST